MNMMHSPPPMLRPYPKMEEFGLSKGEGLFKKVEAQWARGRRVYYWRPIPGGPRHRIRGTPGTEEYENNYRKQIELENKRRLREFRNDPVRRAILKVALTRIKKCRIRDSAKGRLAEINAEWIEKELERLDYKCAVTRIPFNVVMPPRGMNPYTPSIDRIDASRGYTLDNIRIVIFGLNVMMLDWGEDTFHRIAWAYISTRRDAEP